MRALLNDPVARAQIIAGATNRYGYGEKQVELCLDVGRFAGPNKGVDEQRVSPT